MGVQQCWGRLCGAAAPSGGDMEQVQAEARPGGRGVRIRPGGCMGPGAFHSPHACWGSEGTAGPGVHGGPGQAPGQVEGAGSQPPGETEAGTSDH